MSVHLATVSDPDGRSGADWPLGAQVDAANSWVTFAIHAPDATRLQLEIFDEPVGSAAFLATPMRRGADGIWRARLDNLGPGEYYGFRVWGRNWTYSEEWEPGSASGFGSDFDGDGNRFNPNKVLFDPYAREISHNTSSQLILDAGHDAGMFGTGGQDYGGRPRREFDTGPWAPKGVIVDNHTDPGARPRLAPENVAIYEAHVKNLTLHPSASRLTVTLNGSPGFAGVQDVPAELRGTYAGAGLMAPYLKGIGITTVELLPVQETSSGPGAAGTNHWGYQTLGYFAPNRDYAHDKRPGGPTREFKEMVKAFHDAELEVYLDVVYNHTGEGGHWGGDLETTGFVSLGGFATADYYVMTDEFRLVDGATGCANQTNMSPAASQRLVTDSLTYWTDVMGADGFRFDLAPVLGREPDNAPAEDRDGQRRFYKEHPLLLAIRNLAESRQIEVIAEAWDLWGYEVGNFPAGWAEWNGRYRDEVRAFMKGDGNTDAFMRMVNGDFEHFADAGGPQRSINFVDAHDGFTLLDLVSYNHKINDQPYPFGPSDGGTDDNRSWDSGGDHALRRQRLRNFLVALYLSRGVPMVVSGDEYGRTQNGNNNPWNIDTVGVWNNYAQVASHAPGQVPVDPTSSDPAACAASYHDNFGPADAPDDVNPVFRFTVAVAHLRQQHSGLRQRTYGDFEMDDADVSYFFSHPDGKLEVRAGDRALRLLIDASGVGDTDLLALVNMDARDHDFTIPVASQGLQWRLIIDTNARAERDCNFWRYADAVHITDALCVPAWSVCVLEAGSCERRH